MFVFSFRPPHPLLLTSLACLVAAPAIAHEAWLLTPAEIEALAAEPMPDLFTSRAMLALAAIIGSIATCIALVIEGRLKQYEARFDARLSSMAFWVGPAGLRAGLAVMLALAGTGGLPRHGTAPWTEPTLLVPDMELSLLAGFDWLAPMQIVLAGLLICGLFTRLLGLVIISLSCVGLALFGGDFVSYAPHFIAPGLLLVLLGGGVVSLDQLLGLDEAWSVPENMRQVILRVAQILVGVGFVYLAVAYKLTQPTLLIAILQHGQLPSFGLPYPVIALIMTGIEIICGTLLIVGRMIRPVSLAIIGAITFLAVTLVETPLFHANLYATMIIFALAGKTLASAPPRLRQFVRGMA